MICEQGKKHKEMGLETGTLPPQKGPNTPTPLHNEGFKDFLADQEIGGNRNNMKTPLCRMGTMGTADEKQTHMDGTLSL